MTKEDAEYAIEEIVEVALDGGEEIETCVHLIHPPLLYPSLLDGGWKHRSILRLLPSAPGPYELAIRWRGPDGVSGSERVEFRVRDRESGSRARLRRLLVRLLRGVGWAPAVPFVKIGSPVGTIAFTGPSAFEVGALRNLIERREVAAIAALADVVRRGGVVYDVGANLGLYSVVMARLVGPEGRLVCFEPNPVSVAFLRQNLEMNRIAQVEIVPVALLDREGETSFVVDYGNTSLGTGGDSDFFGYKTGQEIRVGCAPLDLLVERLELPPPQFVKVDVEGVEDRVIRGMQRLLSEHRPGLLLELHGPEEVRATLEQLAGHGYRFRVPGESGLFDSAEALLEVHTAPVLQVLAEWGAEGPA